MLNPGGGDELQGIKRGIMEMADIIVVNKADGDAERQASLTAKEYSMALHLMPENENKWVPKVITASALHEKGIAIFWDKVIEYEAKMLENFLKSKNRQSQMYYWTQKTIQDLLLAKIENHQSQIKKGLAEGKLPEVLAREIVG